MKLVFIDFEDSFTNNIIASLRASYSLSVFNYKDILDINFENSNIILGPGPGHPDEYVEFFKSIGLELKSRLRKSRKVVGICLGHQLIFSTLFNCPIVRSKIPMHGRSVRIKRDQILPECYSGINLRDANLQRYNSLTVAITDDFQNLHPELVLVYDENDELVITNESSKLLTMQVHPESVGTSCTQELFQALERFFR